MRHKKSGRKLGRNSSHRDAMYKNMMASLVVHERIKTTVPKAKELRRFIEPLITMAGNKEDQLHARRLLIQRIGDKDAINKILNDLAPFYKDRPGGYLSILKCGFRAGDCAPMAIVSLVGREDQAG